MVAEGPATSHPRRRWATVSLRRIVPRSVRILLVPFWPRVSISIALGVERYFSRARSMRVAYIRPCDLLLAHAHTWRNAAVRARQGLYHCWCTVRGIARPCP